MIAMVRNHTSEVKRQRLGDTQRDLFRCGVEDVRRKVRGPAITGEKIGREHEPLRLAVKSHVPCRVPRKMDRPQSPPDVQHIAIVEPPVGHKRAEAEKGTSQAFQTPCDLRPAAVARTPGIVVGIPSRGGNPGPGLARDLRHVEDMIEMPVGDDDPANGFTIPPAAAESFSQEETASEKSGIEQIQTRRVFQHVKIECRRADLEEIGRQRGRPESVRQSLMSQSPDMFVIDDAHVP